MTRGSAQVGPLHPADPLHPSVELPSLPKSLLVGVSGGVDSMVLIHLLHADGRRVEVAHVNYGLRAGADEDEQLVRAWCEEQGIPVHVLRADAAPEKGSIQAWARDKRYAHFVRTARSRALADVAVAHHADDQAETVALQQARAAGPDGLSGMAASRRLADGVVLHRPLLAWTRADILAYAREHHVVWREDPSNASPAYARTRVREHLRTAPLRATAELLETARIAQKQVDDWLAALPEELKQFLERGSASNSSSYTDRTTRLNPTGPDQARGVKMKVPLEPLRAMPEDMRAWFVLRLVDGRAPRRASTVSAIENLLEAQPGVTAELGGLLVTRDRVHLALSNVDRTETPASPSHTSHLRVFPPSTPPDDPKTSSEAVPGRNPQTGTGNGSESGAHVAWLNAEAVHGPLQVRAWLPGDRFHPFGAPGSRKVKRFLTDAGVPPSEKATIQVVTDDLGIVWIPGFRVDERMRLTPDATAAIRVEWERGEGERAEWERVDGFPILSGGPLPAAHEHEADAYP